jgi:hypothetical protein
MNGKVQERLTQRAVGFNMFRIDIVWFGGKKIVIITLCRRASHIYYLSHTPDTEKQSQPPLPSTLIQHQ